MKQPAKLQFNCYLPLAGLKDVERLFAQYIAHPVLHLYNELPAQPELQIVPSLVWENRQNERPDGLKSWMHLFPGVAQITTKSNRLVIFLPVGARTFAICFGYGSGAFEHETVESHSSARPGLPDHAHQPLTHPPRVSELVGIWVSGTPIGAVYRAAALSTAGQLLAPVDGHRSR